MYKGAPPWRAGVVPAVIALAAGCQQVDQLLPFELENDVGAAVTIGSDGGVVSVPPTFSMRFPAGSFSGTVSVAPRIDTPFPGGAGLPIPGTAFDIAPRGTPLPVRARVELHVPVELLEAGDEVRLGVALERADQSVDVFTGDYDVTNGILVAEIDEIGPVAVVLIADAIEVGLDEPPLLLGGSFSPPPPSPAPGATLSSHGGVTFSSSCSPDGRHCFSSGLIRVWADEVVRRRLGNVMYLVQASASNDLEFLDFVQGSPQTVVGEMRVSGELRARLNRVVSHDVLDEVQSTGLGEAATATSVTFTGSTMTFGATTGEVNTDFQYEVTGIGTSELLIVRIDAEVEFDNGELPDEIGKVVVHVRLRR